MRCSLTASAPLAVIAALVSLLLGATPVSAQTEQPAPTARVARSTVVMEQPRGDSIRVASVEVGDVLEVHDQREGWYLVSPVPSAAAKPAWERGWIQARLVEPVSGSLPAQPGAPVRPQGKLRVRAFGQAGGTLFTARDSFDTILGSPFGPVSGGGAQVVFPNSAFVQVSFERFRETGTRALVSGSQIFTLDTPATLTVQPILATVGYRTSTYGRFAPYLGAGLGWHVLTEDSASIESERNGKVGYHVVGGTEFALGRWVAVAGEVQWAAVPKALGETGVSAVFGEDDLGGTTFRVKLMVGR